MRQLQLIALTFCISMVSACGFSLRGIDSGLLPVQQLVLTHPEGRYPLRAPLLSVLRASDVTLVDLNITDLQLLLSPETQERRAVSINSRAGAGQYEMTLSVDAELHRGGVRLAGPETLLVKGTFYEDTANISGSNRGLDLVLDDLRNELANQIIRRLQAVSL